MYNFNGRLTSLLMLQPDCNELNDYTVMQSQIWCSTFLQLRMAGDDVNMAKADAQMAWDRAWAAKNESEGAKADLQDLLDQITDFLTHKGARPANVRAVSMRCELRKVRQL